MILFIWKDIIFSNFWFCINICSASYLFYLDFSPVFYLYLIILFCFSVQFLQRANEKNLVFWTIPHHFIQQKNDQILLLLLFFINFFVFGFLKKTQVGVSKIILLLYFFVFGYGISELIRKIKKQKSQSGLSKFMLSNGVFMADMEIEAGVA